MAIGVVQRVFAQSSGTAASVVTAAITTTTGNLLVAIPMTNGAHQGATPTDFYSNTWQTAVAATGGTGRTAMFYVPNCIGGAGHTFTFATSGGNGLLVLFVYEITGADLSTPLSNTNSSATNTASHDSGNVTSNSSVPELLMGAMAVSSSAVMFLPSTTLNGNDWSGLSGLFDGANEGGVTAWRVVLPSITDKFQVTSSSATAEGIVIAGFKQAAPTGAGYLLVN